MQYCAALIFYTDCAVNGMKAANHEREAINMNHLLLIPMHSISTMIAEDAGTPELRNPLASVQKNNRKSCARKHQMNEVTAWNSIEKLFGGKYSVAG